MSKQALRVGIGGPVGSGKTALVDALCKNMRDRFEIGVVTNVAPVHLQFFDSVDAIARAEALVAAAHQVCPYSNATRGNLDVGLKVIVV